MARQVVDLTLLPDMKRFQAVERPQRIAVPSKADAVQPLALLLNFKPAQVRLSFDNCTVTHLFGGAVPPRAQALTIAAFCLAVGGTVYDPSANALAAEIASTVVDNNDMERTRRITAPRRICDSHGVGLREAYVPDRCDPMMVEQATFAAVPHVLESSMSEHLSPHHRTTIEHLFNHQGATSLHWREVLSLLNAVGTVKEKHNDKLLVTMGGEIITIDPPKHQELDMQLIVDLRHMFKAAGYAPAE